MSSREEMEEYKVNSNTTSTPRSCELDPIHSKLLIECLDSILPSITYQFNSSLASGIFSQCIRSPPVTTFLKRRCLDHNYLSNYRPVFNLCFVAKILEKLCYSRFHPTSTHSIFILLVNRNIVLVTALKQLF